MPSRDVMTSLRDFLTLVWWHMCHGVAYYVHVRRLPPANQFFHKVVIIGDDFAAGIGDDLRLGSAGGGIAKYLETIVASDDKVRRLTRRTQYHHMYCCGCRSATSVVTLSELLVLELLTRGRSRFVCRHHRFIILGLSSMQECLDPRRSIGSCLHPRRSLMLC